MDEDRLDELEYIVRESPRSMVELYRTDVIQLIDLARETLKAKKEQEEKDMGIWPRLPQSNP